MLSTDWHCEGRVFLDTDLMKGQSKKLMLKWCFSLFVSIKASQALKVSSKAIIHSPHNSAVQAKLAWEDSSLFHVVTPGEIPWQAENPVPSGICHFHAREASDELNEGGGMVASPYLHLGLSTWAALPPASMAAFWAWAFRGTLSIKLSYFWRPGL